MCLLRPTTAVALFAATTLSLPAALTAQAPDAGVDKDYLDFIGSYSGAPRVSAGGISAATGPYRTKFGATSALAAQATEFDVFCIDWLDSAGDGTVSVR